MDILIFLIPVALVLGVGALGAFLWALKNGQFEDLEKEGARILFEEDELPKASDKNEDKNEDKN